ncbi:MAG: uridylate kinase [Methylococcaceae bacterium]|uniref:amino acid kinase family protein n=1 Tax=Methylicorpusculum sp. TaxID=2713644 RepID=UPI0027203D54|nr:uridylate kinase [Methylicorpusculum sp.]MDO9161864.1 uridylate kinase [Methylococcaceae bacterium]MDZ4157804.1 uridylate kinase [Methylococcales bacterium]MDP2392309.1 uridylate kinase [Methylococcaceae bacterium]MDP3021203.1 uridylate kinase [Methylococcaceae bacterium]MDP3389754.1 uridylate kinase [Methylococcaceae bacterium]
MIVVKLGGSLEQSGALLDCLQQIEQHYQNDSVVIVPGGGVFADQVRMAQVRWQFDDRAAHVMALLAMQQMALLINGLKRQFVISESVADIKARAATGKILIWSPDINELDNAGLTASWDITSDSLAAWLASAASASDLIVVKSASIDPGQNLAELAAQGTIDNAFCATVQDAAFNIHIINSQTNSWPKTHLI